MSKSEGNHQNHKTDSPPTPPQNNRSFLSRIMSSSRQSSKKGDTESAQKNDSKTANASKPGSSTSQKENLKKDTSKRGQKKKEEIKLIEIKQKESGKSSKEVGDSKPSNSNTSVRKCPGTPTETHPLDESAQLCGIKTGNKSKVTRTKKQSNCNAQNSCKSCSLHNRDEDDNNAGHDSMESTGKGDPSTSRGGKGKRGKNSSSDYDSMETGGDSTDRDKRAKERRSPGDSLGECDGRRDRDSREMGGSNAHRDKSGKEQENSRDSWVEVAKDPGRQQDGGGGSKLTRSKAKDSGKTAIQGIRGSLDDGHGSLGTDYDMCDVVKENIQKTEDEPTYVNLHDDDDMGEEEGREVEQRDKKGF